MRNRIPVASQELDNMDDGMRKFLDGINNASPIDRIKSIMITIIQDLAFHDYVIGVSAISHIIINMSLYWIKPTLPEEDKRFMIHLLSKPLINSLLATKQSLSYGAALCLKEALVDYDDNWKILACDHEMVNEICQRAADALKDDNKFTNKEYHLGLLLSLAKRYSLDVDAYAGIWIQSALKMIHDEKCVLKLKTQFEMLHSMMTCLDTRTNVSELELVEREMERIQSGPFLYLRDDASKVLCTASRLIRLKEESMIDADDFSSELFSEDVSSTSGTLNDWSENDANVGNPNSCVGLRRRRYFYPGK